VLIGTTFLKQSIQLAFDGEHFDLREVPADGIWISCILAWLPYHRYRVGINTVGGRHYDLQIILREDIKEAPVLETIHRMVAITGYPYGPPILPRFGCCRPDLGAYSLAYLSDLTVWEKIREFSALRLPGTSPSVTLTWRKMLVRAMCAFFVGWHNSEGQIVPGAVTPTNIVVPEPDFREASLIVSLAGWRPYRNTLSLVGPLIRNFFLRTAAYYPWCAPQLDYRWIFDACVEGLGIQRAQSFLDALREDLAHESMPGDSDTITRLLDRYLADLAERFHAPLALECAIDRYREWEAADPGATAAARRQLVGELLRLYRLDRFPEIARYHLYRHTYFAHATTQVQTAMDRLLEALFAHPGRPATRMVELSDLQALLVEATDRLAFSQLVFPRARAAQKVEVLAVGESDRRQVIVRSQVLDRLNAAYEVREPLEPAELGCVYRVFYRAGFPKSISEQDRIFVVEDTAGEIVGGICYKLEEPTVAHLDGIVVTGALRGRGITTALLEDFCLRMAGQGVRVLKTHFFLREFYLRRGFQVDPRWGGLVRFLAS
jgi:GNAT superfamily N-acetyltransferase